jgi:hypothetical protein
MKSHSVISAIAMLVLFMTACKKDESTTEGPQPKYKIVVLSDIHYMDPSLLVKNGTAFQTYLFQDPKLLAESDTILKAAIAQVISIDPDLVMISGDLTKDGERVSHNSVIALLKQLTDKGIKVVVTIGNHDVANPYAMKFDGDNAYPVESITAEEVPTLYSDYGYNTATFTDPNSLSYVCEPLPGLVILAIDANEYYLNGDSTCVTGGKIKPETMTWALTMIAQAKADKKIIFGMMHHGILEHYSGQQQIDPGYVVDDWQTQSQQFLQAGLRVMFTGHYHASDIVMSGSGKDYLLDVETGSLVTAPCAFRTVVLYDDWSTVGISTNPLLGVTILGAVLFEIYKTAFLQIHLDALFSYMLASPPYNLDSATAAFGSRRLRNGMMAHYAGDEALVKPESDSVQIFITMVPPVGPVIQSWWTDLNPQDKSLSFDLVNGIK